jgi:hypothetical protein
MPKASRETASRVEDIEFSPTAEYGRTMQVIGRNLAAMQTSA